MEREHSDMSKLPLCRFGPGGDFVHNWHGAPGESAEQATGTPLTGVLTTIAGLLGITVQPELLTEIACILPADAVKQDQPASVDHKQESTCNDLPRPTDRHHAASTGRPGTNRSLSKQPLLFSDDWGVGRGAQHKPTHRVRTRRRPARKKADYAVERQGTLFTLNGKGKTPHRQGSAA